MNRDPSEFAARMGVFRDCGQAKRLTRLAPTPESAEYWQPTICRLARLSSTKADAISVCFRQNTSARNQKGSSPVGSPSKGIPLPAQNLGTLRDNSMAPHTQIRGEDRGSTNRQPRLMRPSKASVPKGIASIVLVSVQSPRHRRTYSARHKATDRIASSAAEPLERPPPPFLHGLKQFEGGLGRRSPDDRLGVSRLPAPEHIRNSARRK